MLHVGILLPRAVHVPCRLPIATNHWDCKVLAARLRRRLLERCPISGRARRQTERTGTRAAGTKPHVASLFERRLTMTHHWEQRIWQF